MTPRELVARAQDYASMFRNSGHADAAHLVDEMRAFIEASLAPEEGAVPVAWRWRYQDQQEWALGDENPRDYLRDVALRLLAEVQPLFLHPDPKVRVLREFVDRQAEDERLWFVPARITEDTLQKALRELHAAIEGVSPEDAARAALASTGDQGWVSNPYSINVDTLRPAVASSGTPSPLSKTCARTTSCISRPSPFKITRHV